MLLDTLGTSFLGNQVEAQLELVKKQQQRVKDKMQLDLARIFNFALSFNKFQNTKLLSK